MGDRNDQITVKRNSPGSQNWFFNFQKQFEWFLDGQGRTVDFFDGMILLDSGEVA